ncbi:MAG TPA: hypothetical protein VHX15_20560 [Frankiaceae bacterium]|jgi:hypothetical protein|nr:hypothetical protein [Frankiaceae bacterium]
MHADRANRIWLTLIGTLALALGVGGLLAAAGVFGHEFQGRFLADNAFCRYVGRHGNWVWPAIAGVAFVVALLALWWLAALLFSTDRAGDLRLTPPRRRDDHGRRGRTTMLPSALVDAVTAEISDYHGVTGARGRIVGESTEPTLAVDVSASRRTDLPELIERIQREALVHARTALDKPGMRVIVNVSINDKMVSRAG